MSQGEEARERGKSRIGKSRVRRRSKSCDLWHIAASPAVMNDKEVSGSVGE